MGDKTKKGLLLFLFIILLAPFAEQCINFIHSVGLSGAYHSATDPSFSFNDWWDGVFQNKKNDYLNENAGFRPDMVRLNNEIDYLLFDKAHFEWGTLGKEGCLWDDRYINAYIGTDFIGREKITAKMVKCKKLQDTLANLGKTLVFVQAPCKGFYFPECFPDKYKGRKKGITNLDTYNSVSDSLGVNKIDLNAYLLSMKNKTKDVLYPKQGIHWSMYGALLAEDTIVRYIEKKRGISMVHYVIDKIERSAVAQGTDDDMAKPMNLAIPISDEVFTYATISYPDENKKAKPRAIYIGDSFLCQWEYLRMFGHINSNWQMWTYFNSICNELNPYGIANPPRVHDMDWISEVNNADYIVLLFTAKNLPDMGNGFIEEAYDHYYPEK